jgi:hypothetical protein
MMSMASATLQPTALPRGGVLASPISLWAAWSVRFRCGDPCCPPVRPMPVAELLAARGDLSVRAMAGTLRCSVCGQAAADVSLRRACPGGEVIQPVQGAALP